MHTGNTHVQRLVKKSGSKKTQAFKALEKVINDKKTLADVPQLAGTDHTGNVEVFNSVLLSYATKSTEFNFECMDAHN